jgi:hypothetical protein
MRSHTGQADNHDEAGDPNSPSRLLTFLICIFRDLTFYLCGDNVQLYNQNRWPRVQPMDVLPGICLLGSRHG